MHIPAIARCHVVLFLFISFLTAAGCSPSMSSVAGTYELDKEVMREAVKKELEAQEGAGAEGMDEFALAMVMGMIDNMSMTLTLDADGAATFVVRDMGQSDTMTGTWTLDGAAIAITAAEEGEEPSTVRGTVAGETITLDPEGDDDVPFEPVFRRKA